MRFLRIVPPGFSAVTIHLCPLLPLLLSPFLTSCASLKQSAPSKTHALYRTTVSQTSLPKPPDSPIPTLQSPPPRSRILGQFELTTPNGSDFAQETLLYYARHVGADAITHRRIREKPVSNPDQRPLKNEVFPVTREFSDRVWIAGHGGLRGRWEYRRRTEILWLNQSVPTAGHGSPQLTTLEATLIRFPESK